MTSTILEIKEENLEEAGFMSKSFVQDEIRNRAYVNIIGAELLKKYVNEECAIKTDNMFHIHLITRVLEYMDISDLILPNIHIDARVVFDENQIFIPKSHFDLNYIPDVYFILHLSQDLSQAIFLGFIEPKNIDKNKQNDKYYFVDKEDLEPVDSFNSFVCSFSSNKERELSQEEMLRGRELSISAADHNISDDDFKELISLLTVSKSLRESVVEYDNFETLSYSVVPVLLANHDDKKESTPQAIIEPENYNYDDSVLSYTENVPDNTENPQDEAGHVEETVSDDLSIDLSAEGVIEDASAIVPPEGIVEGAAAATAAGALDDGLQAVIQETEPDLTDFTVHGISDTIDMAVDSKVKEQYTNIDKVDYSKSDTYKDMPEGDDLWGAKMDSLEMPEDGNDNEDFSVNVDDLETVEFNEYTPIENNDSIVGMGDLPMAEMETVEEYDNVTDFENIHEDLIQNESPNSPLDEVIAATGDANDDVISDNNISIDEEVDLANSGELFSEENSENVLDDSFESLSEEGLQLDNDLLANEEEPLVGISEEDLSPVELDEDSLAAESDEELSFVDTDEDSSVGISEEDLSPAELDEDSLAAEPDGELSFVDADGDFSDEVQEDLLPELDSEQEHNIQEDDISDNIEEVLNTYDESVEESENILSEVPQEENSEFTDSNLNENVEISQKLPDSEDYSELDSADEFSEFFGDDIDNNQEENSSEDVLLTPENVYENQESDVIDADESVEIDYSSDPNSEIQNDSEEMIPTQVVTAYDNSQIISNKTFTVGEIPIDINMKNKNYDDHEHLENIYNESSDFQEGSFLANPARFIRPKDGKNSPLMLAIAGGVLVVAILGIIGMSAMKMLKPSDDNMQMANNNPSPIPELPKQQNPAELDVNTDKVVSMEDVASPEQKQKSANNPLSVKHAKPLPPDTYLDTRKISWEVPDYVSHNSDFKQYFQSCGKSLKAALSSDLLLASEYPLSDQVRISVKFDKSGTLKKAKVLLSSGSTQVDKIVLQSVNHTLKVLKAPASVGNDESTTVILKIYL